MTRRVLLLLVLLLAPLAAQAFTYVRPLPREFTTNEHCQPYQTYTTAAAEIRVSWCHTDDVAPAGQWMWRPYVWQACLKAKCNSAPPGFSVWNAVDQIKNATDQVAALKALAAQLRIPVAAGSAEETELRIVWSRACKAMTTPPYPGAPPQGWTPGFTFAPDVCPPEPAPPAPTVTQYVTTSTAAYPLNADGTRSITRWPQPAIVGEACDGAVSVLSFGTRFYRIPRLSMTQTVVAGCVVKK